MLRLSDGRRWDLSDTIAMGFGETFAVAGDNVYLGPAVSYGEGGEDEAAPFVFKRSLGAGGASEDESISLEDGPGSAPIVQLGVIGATDLVVLVGGELGPDDATTQSVWVRESSSNEWTNPGPAGSITGFALERTSAVNARVWFVREAFWWESGPEAIEVPSIESEDGCVLELEGAQAIGLAGGPTLRAVFFRDSQAIAAPVSECELGEQQALGRFEHATGVHSLGAEFLGESATSTVLAYLPYTTRNHPELERNTPLDLLSW